MSITFHIAGEPWDEAGERELNVSNCNGYALLEWLGITPDYCGSIKATDLAARCRRRLWPESRNVDEGRKGFISTTPGHATMVDCGRAPGYFTERAEQLLAICELAGNGDICWG